VYHKPVLELVEELKPVVPEGLDTFFFSNSGAEAVEASIKLARHATKKQNIISACRRLFFFFFTSTTSPCTSCVVTTQPLSTASTAARWAPCPSATPRSSTRTSMGTAIGLLLIYWIFFYLLIYIIYFVSILCDVDVGADCRVVR
jgi:hypothetical protein